MRGRPKSELVLSEVEREQLVSFTLRRKTAQAQALRARIVLACADGVDNKVVASQQRVTPQTVSKWRARFVEQRLDGLLDAPRSGAPRTIEDAKVDAVIAKTLESIPEDATHWSTRSMAREAGLPQTAVSRIWRAFGLQPHRQETFKLSQCISARTPPAAIVGTSGDAPTTARLKTAPRSTVVQASNGPCWPNDRRPDRRIRANVTAKISAPRDPICQEIRSLPSPNNHRSASVDDSRV